MGYQSRFVRPDVDVLTISHGDTLTVKRRLNSGERRALFSAMYQETRAGLLRVNPMQVGVATVMAYLVDWSLRDESGQLVDIKGQPAVSVAAALDALDEESFLEIKGAIEAHEQRMTEERSAEKNATGGGSGSSATSPSPS